MAFKIKTPKVSWSRQQLVINDFVFTLELRWMTREAVWVADIFNSVGDKVLTGAKLTENSSLDASYYIPEFVGGNLWVIRVKGSSPKITRDNLGSAFLLTYFTYEEAASAGLR